MTTTTTPAAPLRASVTAASPTAADGPAEVLVDGSETPLTANGLTGYTPTPGDRLLVQRVGGQVEVIQFLSRGTVPYVDQAAIDAVAQEAADAQTSANNALASAQAAQTAANDALTAASGKGAIYPQPSAPAGDPNGLWIDTDDGNKAYTWDTTTSTWVLSQDAGIQAAANAAATADTNAYNAQQAADAANATAATNTDTLTNHETRITDNLNQLNAVSSGLTDYQASNDAAISALQSGYDVLTSVGTAGVQEDYFWVGDDPAQSTVKSVQISTYVQGGISAGNTSAFAHYFGLWNQLDIGDVQYQSDITPPMTTFYTQFTKVGLLAYPCI